MKRRGVRDLKVNASAVLALVKQGETVEITERGTPVALLVPPPKGGIFDQWVARGLVTEATESLDDVEFVDGVPAGAFTDALLALREGDLR